MIDKIKCLNDFVRHLNQVPYLASKNLFKVVSYFLEQPKEKNERFCALLLDLMEKLEKCNRCFIWKEKIADCLYCDSKRRDVKIICVLETWQDFLTVERVGGYNGLYHVLGGSICPLDGVGPEDLTINDLYKRLKNNDFVEEVILAMNQTPEGEATISYIAQKIKDLNVKVSCLARGVPVGSSIEYLDKLTLHKAISERRPY